VATHETYAFGPFTLEVEERRLSQSGGAVVLAPKALDLLVALVRRAGRLISKQELLDSVWPESFVEEGILSVHVSALRKALGDTGRPLRYIETVARSGYRFIAPVTEPTTDRRVIPGRWSIAVLPSRAPAGGGEGAPLIGLAITDSLIDRLGRFDPVVVRPTGAVHSYRHRTDDPAAVGRMLQSDAVVDSSFEQMPDGVRLSARLVRSEDGAALWQGEFADSGGTAAAVAAADALASHLGATPHEAAGHVSNKEAVGSGASRTRPDVYELCGRGRAHLLSASMFEVPNAVEAFQAAVALDPSYPPAHAGLALAHCARAVMRVAPLLEAYHDARTAALRALAVDDRSADAQVALGNVLIFAEWDWPGGERCLRRALEINPNHLQGQLIYGRLLDALGRPNEALEMKLRAFECDPLSPLVHVQIALCYWNQRRYDDAIEWANKALALDPKHLLAREFLAGAYLKKDDIHRYLAEMTEHAACAGVAPEALEPLVKAYAAGGQVGAFHRLQQLSGNLNVPAAVVALFAGMAGELDTAFVQLDRAILDRDPILMELAVGPQWDSLRADPRFEQCVARMGLRVPTV
jgi:DNA-binding winged helix-turn-helix (wHTH) protein/tetratricopeptide (TPR) repeat protein